MGIREQDLEKACIEYLSFLPETFAWKNQTGGTPITSNGRTFIKKAPCTGVSDITIIHKGKVMFVELKVPKGKQSENQKEFQRNVEIAGGSYFIITSLADLKTLIFSESFRATPFV
jgi:hypothetical protein